MGAYCSSFPLISYVEEKKALAEDGRTQQLETMVSMFCQNLNKIATFADKRAQECELAMASQVVKINEAMSKKNRQRALSELKIKKVKEGEMNFFLSKRIEILSMMSNVEQMHWSRENILYTKRALTAMDKFRKGAGMDEADAIDDIIDKNDDLKDYIQKCDEYLKTASQMPGSDIDDSALEEELDTLLSEGTLDSLPSTDSLPTPNLSNGVIVTGMSSIRSKSTSRNRRGGGNNGGTPNTPVLATQL